MHSLPAEKKRRVSRQLPCDRLMTRRVVTSEDERDAEEVFSMLSAVTSTLKQPLDAHATAARVVEAVKENVDPVSRLREEYRKGKSSVEGRKRVLSDVESVYEANKTARTRKDSTAGHSGTDTGESDAYDSFHGILAKHSADRSALNTFKSTMSQRALADLGDFVNASDDADDPFIAQFPKPTPVVFEEDGLSVAIDALIKLASEPLGDYSDDDCPFDACKEDQDEGSAFDTGPSISAALRHSTTRKSGELLPSLKPLVLQGLTDFINEPDDGDEPWAEAKPVAHSTIVASFDSDLDSDPDEPIPASISAISGACAPSTPSSILRRRNAPPTPLSERKRVRFSKKNIQQTSSAAGAPPSLANVGSPSPSSSAPMTRATLKRAQQARQARLQDLKTSKFCKIIDEHNVRCQLCKLDVALGAEQVYDLTEWREHVKGEGHITAESERAEKRAERSRARKT